jgi:hypothetical protein
MKTTERMSDQDICDLMRCLESEPWTVQEYYDTIKMLVLQLELERLRAA